MFCKRNTPFITRTNREYGCRPLYGETACLQTSLASSTKAHHIWNPKSTIDHTDHGGVFNFDFSKDGSILGVACERKSILLFDPFSGKLIGHKNNAHSDCVNCVKFLDNRLFATCSDDTTVALWDLRYMKYKIHTFRGHSNWVKNIEYSPEQGVLLTSGFDGCIYSWNINSYSDEETTNKVFYTNRLMRSKLTPDSSKLLISTLEGYIIVIHNLDLTTLAEDLKGFKPSVYRSMQRGGTPLRNGLMSNHVFEQERNRVEFLADWPPGNEANIISSLQVHPHGWCAISRNTDMTENTEWTCVHDIQDYDWKPKDRRDSEDMSGVTPNTSSAYCSSTNTPAFSSLAPSSSLRDSQTSSSEPDGARSSTSAGDTGEPDRAAEEIQLPSLPTSGNTSDSIIEFRRGARTSSGQLSFSISVHTASGRTIHFDNTDFEGSDDDDDDVQVDRQSGLITIRRNNNPTPDGDLDNQESSEEDSDEEFLENDPVDEDLVHYEHNTGDNVEHYADDDSADDIGNNDNAEENMRNSPRNLPANSTASQGSASSQQSVMFRQPLANAAPGASQSESTNTPSETQSANETNSAGAQSRSSGNQASSAGSQSTSDTQSSSGTQARNNSLYFVLQSNTGRRVLNLTYMDRYSEHEKSVLQKKIHMNAKRLVGYAEECNVGRGFIKEVGFSSDGRLICSPFGFGVRLFAFDSNCHELCDCVPSSPVKLYEVTCSLAHGNCVVATKFSPTQNMVVSGCLDGKIAFHQPVL